MTEADELSFFDALDDVDTSDSAASVSTSSTAQYLIFMVSTMELAVALAQVAEIVPYERVSDLPGTPRHVRGVVHVRGRIIPVFDLAIKLGRTPQSATKRTCILMLELESAGERLTVGIVMDDLATLREVDRTQIRRAPSFGTNVEVRYLDGLLPTERGLLPLVDFQKVFASDELARVSVHATALQANGIDQRGPARDAFGVDASERAVSPGSEDRST